MEQYSICNIIIFQRREVYNSFQILYSHLSVQPKW